MATENKSIVKISNILNLTRQEFSVIEKHILHLILNSLKVNQGFHVKNIDNYEPIIINIDGADVLKNSKNTDALREAIRKITTRSIFFDFSTNDYDYFGSVIPFTYASYESKKGSKSTIEIHLNFKCKKLFLELANGYTNLLLDAILCLKSEYSIRMYELLSMYLKQSKWTVSIEELRLFLNLKATKYKNFNDFERHILIYSQKELLEHCNIYFTWDIAAKQRKKITALTFHISTKDKQEKVELDNEIKQSIDFVSQLSPLVIAQKVQMASAKYTLTPEQVEYIISDSKVFNEFIRIDLIIEAMIEKQKPPKDRTKYLAKSLGLDKVKFK